jgi:hypothetical protein
MDEGADTTNHGGWRHPVLVVPILIPAQLVGGHPTTAEEVDGVIFLHVHGALLERDVLAPLILGGDDWCPGMSGAIEGEEEVVRMKRH